MKRAVLVTLLAAIPLVPLVWWIANNTHWVDTKVPMPLRGEAITNPFYAVQRFANTLGARTRWDRVLDLPPPDAVLVLHAWHWSLSDTRRQAIERWVESGGRLVVDDSIIGDDDDFERWSGFAHAFNDDLDEKTEDALFKALEDEPCPELAEERSGLPSGSGPRLCDIFPLSSLTFAAPAEWVSRHKSGIQAARLKVGRGSVTVINTTPFNERNLFDGDHGLVFVAATQLRRGDEVVFLSEREHPSLLALTWQYGAPAIVLGLTLVGLALWRGGVRFGPLTAAPETARRSLAEQIRGTGQFVLRHGNGEALVAAAVRALNEAAQRRVPNYARLSPDERIAALATATGMERGTIAAAVHQTGVRRAHNLRSSIALIETVRRHLILADTHGT